MSNKLKVLGMPLDEGWRDAPIKRTEQDQATGDDHPLAAILETKFKVEKKKTRKPKR